MPVETPAPVITTPNSTKPAQPVPFEKLSDAQHAKWLKTGELPVQGAKEVKGLDEGDAKPVKADADEADTDTGDADAKPAERGFGSKRPSELRRIAREQQAEISRLKTQLAGAKGPERAEIKEEIAELETAAAPKVDKLGPKPRATDKNADGTPKYKDWEAFEDAKDEWVRKDAIQEFESAANKKEQERTIAAQNTKIEQSWAKRTEESRKQHDDFDDVALDPEGPGKHISRGSVVDQWILESDLGAEILYHFGNDLDDLLRYGKLSPVAAARELTKLEAKLTKGTTQDDSDSPPNPPKREVKVTRAPKPASEVGGRGNAAIDDSERALRDDPTKNPDAMKRFMEAENRKDIRERLGTR